jgi:hypothetical protein
MLSLISAANNGLRLPPVGIMALSAYLLKGVNLADSFNDIILTFGYFAGHIRF